MNDLTQQKRPPGRPVASSERVEMPPTADHLAVENIPVSIVEAHKAEQTTKPLRPIEIEKEHKWFKVHIDLGPSTDKIVINSQEFHHGQIATVRDDLLPVLNEVMYNTKMHERVVRGEASPMGRRLQR